MHNRKLLFIYLFSGMMLVWWAVTIAMGTQEELTNYLWQAGLAVSAIVYSLFGMYVSRHWGGLSSGVGKGVFFIALGLLTWGLGQSGWTYITLVYPEIEVPNAPILDFLYFATVPIWTYGILQLSKATGAKYAFRKAKGKVFALMIFFLTSILSYFMLIEVARGGFSVYFDTSLLPADSLPMWWIAFTDLGYAIGDAVNLALAVTIFGLSWNYLGGRFRKPIVMILFAFGLMYIADFFFSYYDGLGEYYNGHWVDLAYLMVATILGIALVSMDPTKRKMAEKQVADVSPQEAPSPAFVPDNNSPQVNQESNHENINGENNAA